MSTSTATAAAAARSEKREITAIVAATMDNGIGINGGLPWRLPGEMKYFARVTTGNNPSSDPLSQNAVIMGRKTWESIPPKFRPLKDRRNLVISRFPESVDVSSSTNTSAHSSLPSALSSLPQTTPRTFLIGGSTLYTSSLTSSPPLVNRVLLTRILEPAYECDAFLEDFTRHVRPSSSDAVGRGDGGVKEGEGQGEGRKVWKKASMGELRGFVGWDVEEEQEEKGVKYRFEMWVLENTAGPEQ